MASGFTCTVLPSGRLLLTLNPDATATQLEIDPKDVPLIAAKTLVAATKAFMSSQKNRPDLTKEPSEWLAVYPTSIGLVPAKKPNHECLMLEFGEARLGFEFETSILQTLGKALLALGAPRDRAH
jgi:hypothetical protein